MTNSTEAVRDLRALAENATPPPWSSHEMEGGQVIAAVRLPSKIGHLLACNVGTADADLIVAVRNALDDLLGELDGLRAIVNDLALSDNASDYPGQCAMCLGGRPSDGPKWDHAEACPWRRAVEYKEGQP